MQQIIADTTPLNYLVLIDASDVLPRLYGRVLIPPSVFAELSDPHAPEKVRIWLTQSVPWVHVVPLSAPADSSLSGLDAGERDVIALATEKSSVLLMDERDGTAVARARGLRVIGTLSVLDAAAARGWIDLQTMATACARLRFVHRSDSWLLCWNSTHGARKLPATSSYYH